MNATTTKPARTRKPRPRPERKIAVLRQPPTEVVDYYTVRITCGSDVGTYDLCPGRCGNVPVWYVHELAADGTGAVEPYVVTLAGGEGFGDSCTCPGGKYHGHCKHADGLRCLTERGHLPRLPE